MHHFLSSLMLAKLIANGYSMGLKPMVIEPVHIILSSKLIFFLNETSCLHGQQPIGGMK
jgi:hypothetical protein